ncbi:MAG: type II toxin-antitoxin system VapC family toxin [Actinomycetales bacterium]|nr:type II toxin-antitoxin system VapC family toxin [Actinomycetales bacterium]
MRYMLDTNIASFIVRGMTRPRSVAQARAEQWGISSIVSSELNVWLFKVENPNLEHVLSQFLIDVEVAPFGAAAALEYGRLVNLSKAKGRPMSPPDAFIAAHALAEGAILVTNNTKHFEHIEGLVLEDWSK